MMSFRILGKYLPICYTPETKAEWPAEFVEVVKNRHSFQTITAFLACFVEKGTSVLQGISDCETECLQAKYETLSPALD